MTDYRVGQGFDVHALKDGDGVWLGGIKIPYSRALDGHSDADVLIHALCDALLGALSLGDIGHHFPNTDIRYKNISSILLLEQVMNLVREKGYQLGNADCTIVAEAPKINPFCEAMKKRLALVLKTKVDRVSIKATTNEKMGFIGREEGIVAYATVLIYKAD
jgi:2-C-methyl-D-erythritol 2,4-cyclodiphosphate synthase